MSKKDVKAQENQRISFSSTKVHSPFPDFLDIQIKSFEDFFQLETRPDQRGNEGLYKTFAENFPISDTRNQFVLRSEERRVGKECRSLEWRYDCRKKMRHM